MDQEEKRGGFWEGEGEGEEWHFQEVWRLELKHEAEDGWGLYFMSWGADARLRFTLTNRVQVRPVGLHNKSNHNFLNICIGDKSNVTKEDRSTIRAKRCRLDTIPSSLAIHLDTPKTDLRLFSQA